MVSLYLNPDGWLVINQWGDDGDKPFAEARERAERLASRLGYSLLPLLAAVRPAS